MATSVGLMSPVSLLTDDHSGLTSMGSSFINNSDKWRQRTQEDGLSLCQTILPLLFNAKRTGEINVQNLLLSEIFGCKCWSYFIFHIL